MQNYHIVHDGNRWVLREEGDNRALIEADTQDEIVRETRDYMKLRVGSVKIHGRDGTIQDERTYPRDQDPRASKG